MEKLSSLLGLSTPFIWAAASYSFFAWLDSNASEEAKSALVAAMRSNSLVDGSRVASAMLEIFDRIYSSPLLSIKAASRSAAFTAIVSVAYFLEAVHLSQMPLGEVVSLALHNRKLLAAEFSFLVGNMATDYISLFFVRPSLRRFGRHPVSALATGFAIGTLVVTIGTCLRALFYWAEISFSDINSFWYILYMASIFSVPAFAVLGWLPLLGLSFMVLRIIFAILQIAHRTQWALKDGSKQPLKAVGVVSAALVFAFASIWRVMAAF